MLKAYNIVTVLLNLEDINNGKYLGFVVVNISLTLTGKLYHLRLRVECTLFVIYKAGCEPTPYW
jgi:hypothetical protein